MIDKDGNLLCDHCGKLLLAGKWMPTYDDKTGDMRNLCAECFLELKNRIANYEQKKINKIHEFLTVMENETKRPN